MQRTPWAIDKQWVNPLTSSAPSSRLLTSDLSYCGHVGNPLHGPRRVHGGVHAVRARTLPQDEPAPPARQTAVRECARCGAACRSEQVPLLSFCWHHRESWCASSLPAVIKARAWLTASPPRREAATMPERRMPPRHLPRMPETRPSAQVLRGVRGRSESQLDTQGRGSNDGGHGAEMPEMPAELCQGVRRRCLLAPDMDCEQRG